MQLRINGEQVELPDSIQTVQDALNHFELKNKVVIVELNQDILEKNAHETTKISDGDQIEIVHFVGGG